MEGHNNQLLHEENPEDIVAPLTINQVHTDTTSPEDEAELAQIWEHEAKLREIVKGTRKSGNVASAKMRP
jgi:hypothetical protein